LRSSDLLAVNPESELFERELSSKIKGNFLVAKMHIVVKHQMKKIISIVMTDEIILKNYKKKLTDCEESSDIIQIAKEVYKCDYNHLGKHNH
jgi:hypothetical protein